MTKHAFVTGATGFLGVNFLQALADAGWAITALHRQPINHPVLNHLDVNWQKGSLLDLESLRKALPNEPFVAFHMAASTVQWKPQYPMQTRTNVEGTANVLSALRGSHVERLVYTSSITTYGLHNSVITEYSEQRAIQSGLNYAITKYKAEQLIKNAVRQNEIDAVIVNPCHIIGPWDTHNWIQLFEHTITETLPGVPPVSGNFAWVNEVAKAHISAAEKGQSGENYILGGPYASILELVNEMQRQLDIAISKRALSPILLRAIEPFYGLQGFITRKEPTLTPDKVRLLLKSFEADDSKAQRELGYRHKTISEIVRETLAWINDQNNH